MTARSVVVRVDSSLTMGSGHMVRCHTLADALRRRGAEVRFVCRAHAGDLSGMLARDGFTVGHLPPPPDTQRPQRDGDYAAWLGVSEAQDASETAAIVGERHTDWLIVDHYGLGSAWEDALRPRVSRILAIDDLANRAHACDVLHDQNWFGEDTPSRYRNLVPSACRQLLGPRFALMQPAYASLRAIMPPRDGCVRRVLVYFGGSDDVNLTSTAVEALSGEEFASLAVDVVVGQNHPAPALVESQVRDRARTTLHRGLPTLAALMLRADLAVGAGGSTTWERASLALPSVTAVLSDNQAAFTRALEAGGIVVRVNRGADVDEWRETLRRVIADPAALREASGRAAALTDGRGADRVAHVLLNDATSRIAVRMATGRDRSILDDLRADGPAVTASTADSDRLVMVGEDESGLPVGLVTVEIDARGREAGVDVATDPSLSGLPIERSVIRAALAAWRDRESSTTDQSGNLQGRPFARLRRAATAPGRPLRISLLSDRDTWLNEDVAALQEEWLLAGHAVRWSHDVNQLGEGDVCFLIGCSQWLSADHRQRHSHNLVVHESALPEGRGWSPMTWQILEDRRQICVTLFEAVGAIDAGDIHLQTWLTLDGTELIGDWRGMQAQATKELCRRWVEDYPAVLSGKRAQQGRPTYYERRRPADSRLDPARPLGEQFDLLRVVDNHRYPALFTWRGGTYHIHIAERPDGPGSQ